MLPPATPNPFSGRTRLRYVLSEGRNVRIDVFDLAGRIIRRFDEGIKAPGTQEVLWDGRTDLGQRARPGVYFYQVLAGDLKAARRIVLLR